MPKSHRRPKPDAALPEEGRREDGTTVLESASEGVRSGAADAVVAASIAWRSAERFASRFVYTTCYTMSYGVVFPVMLLVSSLPKENAAVRGLIDGGRDGRAKADETAHALTAPRDEAVAALPA